MTSQPSIPIVKSYVYHADRVFFVSMIERDSSAMEGPRRYFEWIAWEIKDAKTMERGEMIGQGEGWSGYFHALRRLHVEGICEEQEG